MLLGLAVPRVKILCFSFKDFHEAWANVRMAALKNYFKAIRFEKTFNQSEGLKKIIAPHYLRGFKLALSGRASLMAQGHVNGNR